MKHKSLTTVPREGRAPSAANHHRDTGRPHHGTAGAAHGLPAPFNLQGRAQDHDDTHKPAGPAGPAEAGRVGLAPARPRPGPSQAQAPRAQSGASAKSTAVVWDGCVCVCVCVCSRSACRCMWVRRRRLLGQSNSARTPQRTVFARAATSYCSSESSSASCVTSQQTEAYKELASGAHGQTMSPRPQIGSFGAKQGKPCVCTAAAVAILCGASRATPTSRHRGSRQCPPATEQAGRSPQAPQARRCTHSPHHRLRHPCGTLQVTRFSVSVLESDSSCYTCQSLGFQLVLAQPLHRQCCQAKAETCWVCLRRPQARSAHP